MDIEKIVKENQQPQPYLLATGDSERLGQLYLVADCVFIHLLNVHQLISLILIVLIVSTINIHDHLSHVSVNIYLIYKSVLYIFFI